MFIFCWVQSLLIVDIGHYNLISICVALWQVVCLIFCLSKLDRFSCDQEVCHRFYPVMSKSGAFYPKDSTLGFVSSMILDVISQDYRRVNVHHHVLWALVDDLHTKAHAYAGCSVYFST